MALDETSCGTLAAVGPVSCRKGPLAEGLVAPAAASPAGIQHSAIQSSRDFLSYREPPCPVSQRWLISMPDKSYGIV